MSVAYAVTCYAAEAHRAKNDDNDRDTAVCRVVETIMVQARH